jgi:HK97 family phage major capsid protein
MKISRKFQIPNWKLNVPTITDGFTGYWIDEASEKTHSEVTFGQVPFILYKACVIVPVSNELLEDSDPAVEGIIRDQFAFCIENTVEKAYLEGTGAGGDPITGCYNAITTNVVNAGVAVSFDNIMDAIGLAMKRGATNISIVYNPRTEMTLRKVKGVDGQYIWGNSVAGSPNTICGFPCYPDYNVSTNLGAGADETYIVVGDFRFAGVGLKSGRGSLVIDVGLNDTDFSLDKTSFRGVFRTDFHLLDETRFAIVKKVK